ncbi:MAG: hypothetical protein U0V74_17235 [Chitinophagales bacterium]
MNLIEVNNKLKIRLAEYRIARKGQEVSIHINAIEIASSLVSFALLENRQITFEERQWFKATYYVSYVLDGSEWQDLSDMYCQICDYLKPRDFKV